MGTRSIVAGIFFLALIFPLPAFGSEVQADSPPLERTDSFYDEWSEKTKEGKKGRFAGTRYYWDEGLHIVSRRENFRLKIGGKFIVDGGYIEADKELERAFPDLEGYGGDFRTLSVDFLGTIRVLSAVKDRVESIEKPAPRVIDGVMSYAPYDALDFKLDIDFANLREIKDIWLRFPRIPFLGYLTLGHMKEPFSLERQTSITNTTFMEWALPNEAFVPSRNIGIMFGKPVLNERMTLAAGGFLNTGSFSDVGEASNRMTEANGYNLTARVTGLPWYGEEGKRLLHLGLSYSHGIRNDKDIDDRVQFRARPESRITDERLVDTGFFFADNVDLINPELAIVLGPFSLQGEYFHTFTDADGKDDPEFWGFYVYGSFFITGENRNYSTSRGMFARVRPKRNFRPLKGGWGAWELGARFSYIDLNDEGIKGGRERNVTAGLNWYLSPNFRFMFNYVRANVKDRARPQVDNGRAQIYQARFQVAF
jgi:phosphate-selective porin OprO/OprP